MTQENLNAQIKQLHETLGRTQSLETETQKLLSELEEYIRPLVKEPNADKNSLADRLDEWLDEAIAGLEADHPILTTQIKGLIEALSNMGI